MSGITDYYETLYDHHFGENNLDLHHKGKKVFELVSKHEEVLMKELIEFLKTKKNIRMIGKQTHARCDRMPTVSFTVKDKSSLHVAQERLEEIILALEMVNFMPGDVCRVWALSQMMG